MFVCMCVSVSVYFSVNVCVRKCVCMCSSINGCVCVCLCPQTRVCVFASINVFGHKQAYLTLRSVRKLTMTIEPWTQTSLPPVPLPTACSSSACILPSNSLSSSSGSRQSDHVN